MVTYVWQPGETKNNKYVYLCGGVSDTPNSSLAEQSRQLAANIVNNESEYATKFGNISSYLDENVVENGYRYYWQPNSECFYGICDVQATIYQTPDRTPNVITALEHTNNGSVLFIDFYNLVGKDGTNGTSATGKTNLDYRYASSASTYPANMIFTEASGTSPFGAWYLGVAKYDPKTEIVPFSTSDYTWTKIKGEDGHDGGVKANWGDLTEEQKQDLRGELKGDDGQDGAAGAPGVAAFKSIVFTRNNADSVDTPTGGDYNNPWPEQTAWSDGVPSGDAKLWMSTRIFTSDGSAPQQDSWTEPEIIADTAYMDYEFSSASTRPIAPEKETPSSTMTGDTWHNEATDEDIWMAYRQVENGEYKTGSNWTITKIKGEDGEDGEGFTLGEPWSTVATFENTEGADENEYHVYTGHEEGYEEHTGWLFKWIEDDDFGPEDIPFTGGTGYWHPVSQFEGTPGQSYFTHIKYANKVLKPSEDPECIESAWTVTTINVDSRDIVIKLTGDPDDPTAPRGEDSGNYIGVLANGEEQDPHAASAYTWSSWKGRDGYGVEYIYTHTSAYTAPVVPICDTASTDYQTAGYVPVTEIETSGVTWEDDPMDTTAENPYVWLVSRKNIDSTWHAFVGSKDEPAKAVLFAKYGLDGETPEARFTSVVFKVSAEVPTAPNNLSGTTEVAGKLVKYNTYDSPMPNPEEGWTDTISGMSPYACIWMATRIFTTDITKQLQDGYRWSNPVRANDTDSIDNEWLTGHTTLSVSDIINNNLYPLRTSPDDANPGTGQLNPDGHGWYDDPVDNATFMASVKIVNGEYERVDGKINWKITKIKGEKGDAGKSYTLKEQETGEWLDTTEKNPEAYDISMYDAHVCSSAYTATTEGGEKIYTEGNLYVWDGDSWEDAGKFAPDSSYIHVKYANEAEDGTEIPGLGKKLKFTGDESTLGEVPGAYLGILNDAVEEDSRIITDYTWSLTKGKDGFGYEYIYCLSDSVPAQFSEEGINIPVPHLTGDTRFEPGDEYSGSEITNASQYQNDDFIPTVNNTNIVWGDDPLEPTLEKPFCYMAYRKKSEEGKWGEYRGTGLEGKFATLFTRYTKDGEDGVDGPGAEYIYILKTDEHAFDNFGELTSGPKYKYAGSTAWTEANWAYNGAMYDKYNFIPGTWRDSATTLTDVDEWSDDPLELTATLPIEFVSVRYKEIDAATGNMVWTPFSQPRVWARYSKDGIDGSVLSSVTEYYIATSAMTPTPTSGSTGADWHDDNWGDWTINATPENFNATNKYLWNSEACKYMDGMITTTAPAMIGTYSKDIDYILEYYAVSNSQIIPPTGWEEEIPEEYSWTTVPSAATTTEGNPYLWNFERIYYADGTYETHEPAVIGTKGRDAVLYALELSNDIDVFGTGPDKRLDNPVTATTTLIAYHNGKKENVAIKTVSAEISPAAGWEVSYNGIGTSDVDVTIEIPTGTTFTSETPYHVTLTATVQAAGYSEYEGTVVFKVIGNKEGADGVSYKLLSNYDQIVWSGNTSTPAIENWKFSAVTMSNGVQMPLECDFKFDVDGESAIVDLASSCSFPNNELDAPRSSMTVTIYANGDSSFIYDKESFPVLYQGKDGEPGKDGVNYEIISNYDSRVITVDSEGQVIEGVPDDGETWVFTAYKVVGETSAPVEVFWMAKVDDNEPAPLDFQWSSCTFDDIFDGAAELPLSSLTIEIFADSDYQEVLKSKSFPVIQNGQKGEKGDTGPSFQYRTSVWATNTEYHNDTNAAEGNYIDTEYVDIVYRYPMAMVTSGTPIEAAICKTTHISSIDRPYKYIELFTGTTKTDIPSEYTAFTWYEIFGDIMPDEMTDVSSSEKFFPSYAYKSKVDETTHINIYHFYGKVIDIVREEEMGGICTSPFPFVYNEDKTVVSTANPDKWDVYNVSGPVITPLIISNKINAESIDASNLEVAKINTKPNTSKSKVTIKDDSMNVYGALNTLKVSIHAGDMLPERNSERLINNFQGNRIKWSSATGWDTNNMNEVIIDSSTTLAMGNSIDNGLYQKIVETGSGPYNINVSYDNNGLKTLMPNIYKLHLTNRFMSPATPSNSGTYTYAYQQFFRYVPLTDVTANEDRVITVPKLSTEFILKDWSGITEYVEDLNSGGGKNEDYYRKYTVGAIGLIDADARKVTHSSAGQDNSMVNTGLTVLDNTTTATINGEMLNLYPDFTTDATPLGDYKVIYGTHPREFSVYVPKVVMQTHEKLTDASSGMVEEIVNYLVSKGGAKEMPLILYSKKDGLLTIPPMEYNLPAGHRLYIFIGLIRPVSYLNAMEMGYIDPMEDDLHTYFSGRIKVDKKDIYATPGIDYMTGGANIVEICNGGLTYKLNDENIFRVKDIERPNDVHESTFLFESNFKNDIPSIQSRTGEGLRLANGGVYMKNNGIWYKCGITTITTGHTSSQSIVELKRPRFNYVIHLKTNNLLPLGVNEVAICECDDSGACDGKTLAVYGAFLEFPVMTIEATNHDYYYSLSTEYMSEYIPKSGITWEDYYNELISNSFGASSLLDKGWCLVGGNNLGTTAATVATKYRIYPQYIHRYTEKNITLPGELIKPVMLYDNIGNNVLKTRIEKGYNDVTLVYQQYKTTGSTVQDWDENWNKSIFKCVINSLNETCYEQAKNKGLIVTFELCLNRMNRKRVRPGKETTQKTYGTETRIIPQRSTVDNTPIYLHEVNLDDNCIKLTKMDLLRYIFSHDILENDDAWMRQPSSFNSISFEYEGNEYTRDIPNESNANSLFYLYKSIMLKAYDERFSDIKPLQIHVRASVRDKAMFKNRKDGNILAKTSWMTIKLPIEEIFNIQMTPTSTVPPDPEDIIYWNN